MFRRLLIANRGEVAVRIARAARSLGIAPVGVASEADLGASWLEAMDEFVCLGPGGRARELPRRRARRAGRRCRRAAPPCIPAGASSPENARFAALCAQHGLVFVGPGPATMSRMGLKTPAKRAMRAAGLAVIPAPTVRSRTSRRRSPARARSVSR
jgi:acetyl-CoA carboxylase biotin carboxylase subunit